MTQPRSALVSLDAVKPRDTHIVLTLFSLDCLEQDLLRLDSVYEDVAT